MSFAMVSALFYGGVHADLLFTEVLVEFLVPFRNSSFLSANLSYPVALHDGLKAFEIHTVCTVGVLVLALTEIGLVVFAVVGTPFPAFVPDFLTCTICGAGLAYGAVI